MSRRRSAPPPPGDDRIVDIDVDSEMRTSFLEYAYSVIYARALPDARDGLKPVQRRILYQMAQMGLRPDRGHVKSARVVGEVMGRLHPHGDSAIYDALVRMAQPFTLRLPMVDGHGNFGSLDDGPAAMRYTECRLAPAALAMTDGLDEDVVDVTANYDGRETEPVVLPAAIPALLVNGAAGIAVGMATAMPPHNLGEVMAAAVHLTLHPDATAEDLMRFVPGPDLPGGGTIIGLDGVREAYLTGRGSFRIRASTAIEQITPRRRGIVITELPPSVGPERVIERLKDLVSNRKIEGISDVVDLTDGEHGLRLVIECKNTVNPEALLHELYRLTPLEDGFTVNAVALVDGEPRTLGLRELISVFVEHRLEVVRRRSRYRRTKAQERLHLVEGLLIAILDIDEVIAVIRSSDDTAAARERLIAVFDLTEVQASYILEMPLRRLTKFSRIELEAERSDLAQAIVELTALLDDEQVLRTTVAAEMRATADAHATPRRTILMEAAAAAVGLSLEVADEPCTVMLSSTGLMARIAQVPPPSSDRASHDVVAAWTPARTRGEIAAITTAGRAVRVSVLDLPALPVAMGPVSLAGGAPLGAVVDLPAGEQVIALCEPGTTVMLGTRSGTVKRVLVDDLTRDAVDLIALSAGDAVVGAAAAPDTAHLLMVTSDAQALLFRADTVRVQGRGAAGMAGIKVAAGATVLWAGVVTEDDALVTVAGTSDALPGTAATSVKVSAIGEIPAKGRATGGVRCQRFLKGEDCLVLAWAGPLPARAAGPGGGPVPLPAELARRDASGSPLRGPIAGIGGPVPASQ